MFCVHNTNKPYDANVHAVILCFLDSILGPCHPRLLNNTSKAQSLLYGTATQQRCARDVHQCGRYVLLGGCECPTHLWHSWHQCMQYHSPNSQQFDCNTSLVMQAKHIPLPETTSISANADGPSDTHCLTQNRR